MDLSVTWLDDQIFLFDCFSRVVQWHLLNRIAFKWAATIAEDMFGYQTCSSPPSTKGIRSTVVSITPCMMNICMSITYSANASQPLEKLSRRSKSPTPPTGRNNIPRGISCFVVLPVIQSSLWVVQQASFPPKEISRCTSSASKGMRSFPFTLCSLKSIVPWRPSSIWDARRIVSPGSYRMT